MRVIIRSFAMIREILGSKEITVELSKGSTILILLDNLVLRYGDLKSILFDIEGSTSKSNVIALNDVKVEHTEFSSTYLKNDDIIHIIPPAGGG